MRLRARRLAILLALFGSPAVAEPGIDCREATKPATSAICATPGLLALDGEMAEAWTGVTKALANRPGALRQTKAQHERWLGRRDQCGDNVDCIASAYMTKIATYRQMLGLPVKNWEAVRSPVETVPEPAPTAPQSAKSPAASTPSTESEMPQPQSQPKAAPSPEVLAFCDVLRRWGDQFVAAYPDTKTLNDFLGADPAQKENLFLDEHFVPYFGIAAEAMREPDWARISNLWYDGFGGSQLHVCNGPEFDLLRGYWTYLSQQAALGFGQDHSKAYAAQEWLGDVTEQIELLAATAESISRIDQLLAEADTQLQPLWPNERASLIEKLKAKRSQLAAEYIDTTLNEPVASGDHLEVLRTLQNVLPGLTLEESEKVREKASAILHSYIDVRLSDAPASMTDLGSAAVALAFYDQLETDVHDFADLVAMNEVTAEIERQKTSLLSSLGAILTAELDPNAELEAFQSVQGVLQELRQSQDIDQSRDQIWGIYYASADAWVAARLSDAKGETSEAPASKDSSGFDAANPLGQDSVDSFDPTNPLGQADPAAPVVTTADAEFSSKPWKAAELIVATYNGDNATLYDLGSDTVILYLAQFSNKIALSCPNIDNYELKRLAMGSYFGFDPFNASPDDVANYGMKSLEQTLTGAYDFGGAMRGAMETEEVDRAQTADAGLMLSLMTDCYDPRLERFLANATSFAVDPTGDVPAAKLDMEGLCVRDYRAKDTPGGNFEAYCKCAAPKLDALLNDNQRRFISENPGGRISIIGAIYPDVRQEVQLCQQ